MAAVTQEEDITEKVESVNGITGCSDRSSVALCRGKEKKRLRHYNHGGLVRAKLERHDSDCLFSPQNGREWKKSL